MADQQQQYEFDAPQFVDFSAAIDDDDDTLESGAAMTNRDGYFVERKQTLAPVVVVGPSQEGQEEEEPAELEDLKCILQEDEDEARRTATTRRGNRGSRQSLLPSEIAVVSSSSTTLHQERRTSTRRRSSQLLIPPSTQEQAEEQDDLRARLDMQRSLALPLAPTAISNDQTPVAEYFDVEAMGQNSPKEKSQSPQDELVESVQAAAVPSDESSQERDYQEKEGEGEETLDPVVTTPTEEQEDRAVETSMDHPQEPQAADRRTMPQHQGDETVLLGDEQQQQEEEVSHRMLDMPPQQLQKEEPRRIMAMPQQQEQQEEQQEQSRRMMVMPQEEQQPRRVTSHHPAGRLLSSSFSSSRQLRDLTNSSSMATGPRAKQQQMARTTPEIDPRQRPQFDIPQSMQLDLGNPNEDKTSVTAAAGDGYRVKHAVVGTRNVPGYMTPTESSKSKNRDKMTPTLQQQRPMSPSQQQEGRKTPTLARAPRLQTTERRRRFSSEGSMMTSTTRELEQIRQERAQREQERVRNQQRLQALQHSQSTATARVLTRVQPFPSLDADTQKRLEMQAKKQEYHSTAELVATITRDSKVPSPVVGSSSGTFHPQTPTLRVIARTRPTVYKTSEDMELEKISREVEEAARRKQAYRQALERSMNDSMQSSQKRTLTQPQPFELESVSRHEKAQRDLRLQEEKRRREEEEKRTMFRARPVPSSSSSRPVVQQQQRTHHEPVAPHCVERAMYAEQLRLNKLEMECKEQERNREFHARPLPRTTYERGFSPAPAETSLVEPCPPSLRTDERAEKRAQLDVVRREQERAEQEEREQREERERHKEQEDLKEYRRNLVHKALPLPATSKFTAVYEQQEEFNGNVLEYHEPAALQTNRRRVSTLGGGAHRVMVPSGSSEQEM